MLYKFNFQIVAIQRYQTIASLRIKGKLSGDLRI
jgi:hypothetical protein